MSDNVINIFDKANDSLQDTRAIDEKKKATDDAIRFGSTLKNEIESEAKKRIPDYVRMRQAYDNVMSADPEALANMDNDELHNAMMHEIMTGKAEADNQAQFAVEFKKKTAQALSAQEKDFYSALSLADKMDEMYQSGEDPQKLKKLYESLNPGVQKHIAKIKTIRRNMGTNSNNKTTMKAVSETVSARTAFAESDKITQIAQDILSSINKY